MRTFVLASAAVVLSLSSPIALGDDAAKPASAPDLTVKPPPALDFVLLDEKPGLTARDPAFEAMVARRRTLLSAHQATGIATWALMGTTVVVGQLNYRDLYGGGGYTQRYRQSHRALAAATATTFAFTGILAAMAPVPYPKKLRLDTATIHKASMAVTTLGIVSQIVLGIWTHRSPANMDQLRLAQVHQAVGYATFGAMTIGAVTLLF